MTRRGFSALGWAPLLAGAVLAVAASAASEEASNGGDRPVRGVLLITVDTLRADHVGAYGGPVPTPNIDRLAAEGTLVERATAPRPPPGRPTPR